MSWSEIKTSLHDLTSFQVQIGQSLISVVDVVLFVCILVLTIVVTRIVSKAIVNRLLKRFSLQETIMSRSKRIIQLIIFLTGFFIALG